MRKLRPWLMLLLALGSGALAAYLALRYLREQATPLLAAEPRKARSFSRREACRSARSSPTRT